MSLDVFDVIVEIESVSYVTPRILVLCVVVKHVIMVWADSNRQ